MSFNIVQVQGTSASADTNTALPTQANLAGGSDGTNVQAARVHDLDTGGGTEYDLGVSVRLPGAGGSVAGGTATNPIRVDPTGTTTQPVSGTVAVSGTVPVSGTVAVSSVGGTVTTAGTAVVTGPAADGAAVSGNPVRIAGSDGTNTQDILTTTAGNIVPSLPVDRSGSGSLTALATAVTIATAGAGVLCFQTSGTASLTAIVEGSADGGTVWKTIPYFSNSQTTPYFVPTNNGFVWATTATLAQVPCAGLTHVRVRCSAYTSGTGVVTYNLSAAGRPNLAVDQAGRLVPSTMVDTITNGSSIGALNAEVDLTATGVAGINAFNSGHGFFLSSSLIGTVVIEGTQDNATWFPIYVMERATQKVTQSFVNPAAGTAFVFPGMGGLLAIRARISDYTSGSCIPNLTLSASAPPNFGPVLAPSMSEAITAGFFGTNSGEVVGRVTAAAASEVAVNETTYNVQATGTQRSVSSASANDTSAGTGARTIRITYYAQTGNGAVTGPFTEDLTMNGVTTVNTTATNIRHIESIEVLTAGSGGTNAGIITLFISAAGAGGTLTTIAASSRRTRHGIHHVPTGLTCYISDLTMAASAALASTASDTFELRWLDLGTANAAERVLKAGVSQNGAGTSFGLSLVKPLKVVGPAKILGYVTPSAVTSHVAALSYSYVEE